MQHGLGKKKPFGEKNSTADAMLLFSVAHWAQKRPRTEVHFYTLNHKDFSDPDHKELPHSDIAQFFAPSTNLFYHHGLQHLMQSIQPLRVYDFYPEHEGHGCGMCDGPVPIEEISCDACGEEYSALLGEEDYTLKNYRGGYLIDVSGERISCSACQRKTFRVELAGFCSYHHHVMSNDD